MLLQIGVAMKAMPWYCALPTISEYMIEHGWTKCFSRISDVGWAAYLCYLIVYLVIVEFGIYWMHRELHDIKPLYKYLHATHHIYNKQNTLSPFAGNFLLLLISIRVILLNRNAQMFQIVFMHPLVTLVKNFCTLFGLSETASRLDTSDMECCKYHGLE